MKTEKDYIEDILPDELREIYFTEDDQTAYEEPMKEMPQQPSDDQPVQDEKQDEESDFPEVIDSEDGEEESSEPKTAIDYEKQSIDEIKDAKTMINGIIAELEATELNTPDEYEALAMDLSLAQEKLDWAGKILHRVGKMTGEKQKIQKQINPQVPESPATPPSMRQNQEQK